MKFTRVFAFSAFICSMISCTDRIPVPVDDAYKDPITEKDATRFTCKDICWIGAHNGYYDEMASRTNGIGGNITNSPSVIFLDMSEANANLGKLGQSYDNGSVIVVLNPEMDKVSKLMELSGWYHMYPSTGDLDLYAFSKRGAYAIHKAKESSVMEGETEYVDGTKAIYEYCEDDVEGPVYDPYAGYDFSELGYYLRPFVKWVNEMTSSVNDDFDGYATFTDQYRYDLNLYVHHVALSSKDYIKGPYSISVNFKYKPMYIFADDSYSPGDYYLVNATYISETGDIFKGDDFTHKHGGITVHICGAFLREFNVLTYIDGDGNNPKFISNFEPIPESDINTKSYSKTHAWNVGGGVTGGFSRELGPHIEASFDWGVSNSNTVTYEVSDLGVRNNMHTDYQGHGAAASWTFLGQNLPGPKGDKGFNGTTPQIARSTGVFHTSWVWFSNSHKEGDNKSLGEIVTVINPVLGGAHNGLCVDGEKNTWKIPETEFRAKMVVPIRIPFGTISIDNTFKNGEIISDVVATNCETGKVEFTSFGDFSQSRPCEFSVPEGKYDITMKVTDTNRQTVNYKIINPVQLQRRRSENDIYNIDSFIRFKPEETL